MAGLIKENFKEEVLTELSWIMAIIDDLSITYGIETYETTLIKYRVQPEEERAISQFFVLHIHMIDKLNMEEAQKKIASLFFETTKREWSITKDVVEKLINLKRLQLGI